MISYINSKTDAINLVKAAKRGEIEPATVENVLNNLISEAVLVEDVQTYPEGYGEIGYEGETLEPIWEEKENPGAKIFKIGLTVSEVEAMIQEVQNV